MIEHLRLKFGQGAQSKALEFPTTSITVFVGPNNCGKSLVLRELHQSTHGADTAQLRIVDDVRFKQITMQEFLDQRVAAIVPAPHTADVSERSLRLWTNQIFRQREIESVIGDAGKRQSDGRNLYALNIVSHVSKILDGSNRLNLVNPQQIGDLFEPQANSLARMYLDDDRREQLRSLVRKSWDGYILFDPTMLGTIRLRWAEEVPPPGIERQITDNALSYLGSRPFVTELGDGIKAFVGTLIETSVGQPEVLFVDEPEAFLHPPLQFALGKEIALMLGPSKKLFASTHSSQFLMGLVQTGYPINVVRLTREGGGTARLLPADQLTSLMHNPLLRSANVLSALFYRGAVVTEGDTDRAFYQEMNERLLAVGRGIPDCIFLNAQNKQTIPVIVGALRSLGLPAASIYDVDFFKDKGKEGTKHLAGASIPEEIRPRMRNTRARVLGELRKFGNFKLNGGLTKLKGQAKLDAEWLVAQLREHGAFVLPHGEIEAWLTHLKVGGHGTKWLIKMFKKLGDDPTNNNYVRPQTGDVWEFVDEIGRWIGDPNRKGIPG